jgi:hypothetical protein
MSIAQFANAARTLEAELEKLACLDPNVLEVKSRMNSFLASVKKGEIVPGSSHARSSDAWKNSFWRPDFPLFQKLNDPNYSALFRAAEQLSNIQTHGSIEAADAFNRTRG